MRPAHGREAGLTLVELLVSVGIAATIAPVLVGALVVGWRTTDATIADLSDSRNRQVAPSLFTRDVQAAQTVDTTSTDSTCTSTGDTLLVRFRWTETDVAGSTLDRTASWVLTSGTERLVERRWCATGSTVTSSVTASHGVVGTPAAACSTLGGAAVSCGSAVRVSLGVTDASGTFTAAGLRRTS